MKLHSDHIDAGGVRLARLRAREAGNVSADVTFVVFNHSPSRSRKHGYEIQLGTLDKTSGPTTSRHLKNRGDAGASDVYAATYDEWGWILAELFAMDAEATIGPYKGVQDFNEQTRQKFASVANQGLYGSLTDADDNYADSTGPYVFVSDERIWVQPKNS